MNGLELRNVCKQYPEFAIENLTLTLPSGCILGLVGENGAGKSTTIRMILDMAKADSGEIFVMGQKMSPRLREDIGVVLGEPGIPDMKISQIRKVLKNIYQNWDDPCFSRLIAKFRLPEKKPYLSFSRGMKMKLGLAIALSHGAKLLILDEATSGLDPVVRDEVLDILLDFTRDEGHSVLISSHIVSDLEKICDYIAFLHQGKLLLCQEKDALLEEYAIVHGSREAMENLQGIAHRKVTPYGAEALICRDAIPQGMPLRPVTLEELFVLMVKEEDR